jgi:hypothetical protein
MPTVQVTSNTEHGAGPMGEPLAGAIMNDGELFMGFFGYDPDIEPTPAGAAPNEATPITSFSIELSGVTKILNNQSELELYPFTLLECTLDNPLDLPSDIGIDISTFTFIMPDEPDGSPGSYQGFKIDVSGKFTIGPNLFITYRVGLEDVVTTDNICEVAQAGGSITNFKKPRGVVETPISFTIKSGLDDFKLNTMLAATPVWGAINAEPLESEVCQP